MKPSTSLGRETSPSPDAFPSNPSAPTAPTATSATSATGTTANSGVAPGESGVTVGPASMSAPAPGQVGMVRKVVAIVLALLAYHNFLQIQQPIHVHEFYVIAALLGVPLACIRHFAGRCPRLETAGWIVLVFQTLVAVRSL